MKMLFVNQFFWPDSSATSQQLTDLVTVLGSRSTTVSVLCGDSGGYASAAGDSAPPAEVYRVRALPFKRGRIGRMVSYVSFYVSAFARGLILPRQDVVVSMTTPPLIALLGGAIKLLRGSRHFIWEQDLYPEIAVDLAYIKPGGLTHRITGMLADAVRRQADGIIVLGPCMKERLVARGISPEKIHIAEHWASSAAIRPLPRPGNREELVLLYSGNLGLAHDLDTIEKTMLRLRNDPRFRFLFAGTGGKREQLMHFLREHDIQNVEMRPFVDRDKLSEGLAAGDIGLVTQTDASCGALVPSKVYGILAAGRPLLFIGPARATPALLIARHDCGWHFDCGDAEGVTALLLHLSEHPELVMRAGARAREALLRHYDLPQSVDRIAEILGAADLPSTSRAGLQLQTIP